MTDAANVAAEIDPPDFLSRPDLLIVRFGKRVRRWRGVVLLTHEHDQTFLAWSRVPTPYGTETVRLLPDHLKALQEIVPSAAYVEMYRPDVRPMFIAVSVKDFIYLRLMADD